MTVKKKVLEALCLTPLFAGVSPKQLSPLLENQAVKVEVFKKGDKVFNDEIPSYFGFVIKGGVNITRPSSGVLVAAADQGKFFGLAPLYAGEKKYDCNYTASAESKILFIDKTTFGVIMLRFSSVTSALLSLLADEVYYLNNKIDTFTGGTAENKLAAYLLESFAGYKIMRLEISYTKLAVTLNIGRASLYRAFDTFINEGILEKDGKFIRLLNEEKLIEYKG